MAADGGEGKKEIISSGGGFLPSGFRFAPTNEELVRYYLLPRLLRRPPVPNAAVIEANVYLWHPDRLIGLYRERGEDSWYFLTPRARKYTNGERPSRHTEDGLGRWKASTGMSEGKGVVGDGTKFCHRVLAYHDAPISTETKTKWLMLELTIPEFEKKVGEPSSNPNSTLDEYVMCKIYVTPRMRKKGKNDDEAGPSGVRREPCPPAESGGQEAGTSSAAPEKQAGKRVVEEKKAPKKRARQQNNQAPSRTAAGPPAPALHGGGGTHAPGGTAAPGCYVRPTAYDARAPMPRPLAYQLPAAPPGHCRPPVAYNNGMRMPVQRPPQTVAYNNGMRMPVQQQPVAYNNGMRMPVQQQPVAYNNGMRMPVQRPQMAYNNGMRMPVQRPPQTVAYNNGMRMPVQQQPMAYNNGQARPPVQRPQTVAYNNGMQVPGQQHPVAYNNGMRMPVPHQMVTYNNGMQPPPVQRPQTMAHNNGMQRPPASAVQSPPYHTANAPGPRGHGMPTMRRPSNPSGAGQAAQPPAVSRPPPPKREQADTDEQRTERVYRQHVEEWQRIQTERRIEAYAAGQQPYVGVNYNHHAPAAAMAAPDDHLPPCIFYAGEPGQQSQLSGAVQPASTSGSGAGEAAASPLSSSDEEKFVESALVETPPDENPSVHAER